MIGLLVVAALSQAAPASSLELACAGYGSTAYASQIREIVSLQVNGQTVRILYPTALYPDLASGGGWLELHNTSVDDRYIQGRFTLNWLNRPTVVVDRATGIITVQGFHGTGFRGDCAAVDRSQRRF